jgi:uncharacterized repeat protein (TIGR03803 family)
LVNFTGSNGSFPYALLVQGSDGNFYGTTYFGGSVGYGTVFKITTDGNLTTLVSFNSAANGANPRAGLVQGSDGNFYGTTQYGGSSEAGTVFKMTPDGTLTTLVNFNNTNGANPHAGLVEGSDGNFYGTTQNGGSLGYGTVFQTSPNGLVTTLVNFRGSTGTHPYGGLIQCSDGNFYGTTYGGGSGTNCYFTTVSCGTLYRMTPSGTLTTLVNLTNSIGAYPYAELVQGSDGNFYGTTSRGGSSLNCSGGCGTVLQLTPSGTLTTQVNFSASNGSFSAATLVQGSDGKFYGTTNVGGSSAQGGSSGYGTIFQLNVGAAPPIASITSFTPASGPVGTTVVITGANFVGTTGVKFNGIPATSFTVNNASHITATLPLGAMTGKIMVTTAGGSVSSAGSFSVTPTISSFTPSSGPVGTSVVLAGNNFTGASSIRFNGIDASSFMVNSDTQITATVPAGATTGTIAVITPSGIGVSTGNFTVIPAPTINSFTPTSGPVGTAVLITGSNLTGATRVSFNGVNAVSYTVNSDTQITVTVPTGATTGTLTVITPGGTATSASSFTVLPAPTISSFSPVSGPIATTVTIKGTHFTGTTAIVFNKTAVTSFTVKSDTQLSTRVPNGATTGPIKVTAPGGTATSSTSFVVKPKINSFTPTSGPVGTLVTITGNTFGGATSVTFNGVLAATFKVKSVTKITATVPIGATTGPIAVTTSSGTATSTTNFTVTP